jgi:hypothetical protein
VGTDTARPIGPIESEVGRARSLDGCELAVRAPHEYLRDSLGGRDGNAMDEGNRSPPTSAQDEGDGSIRVRRDPIDHGWTVDRFGCGPESAGCAGHCLIRIG